MNLKDLISELQSIPGLEVHAESSNHLTLVDGHTGVIVVTIRSLPNRSTFTTEKGNITQSIETAKEIVRKYLGDTEIIEI